MDPNLEMLCNTLDALASSIIVAHQRRNSSVGNQGTSLERFRKMQPPIFAGGHALEQIENWLMELEKFFIVFDLDDHEKLSLAAFQLIGDASRWYYGISQREVQPMTWERFIQSFEEEYYPTSWKDKKYDEFMCLK